MGTKQFFNNTSYDVSVVLQVRHGDNPGTDLAPKSLVLNKGQRQSFQYSTDADPYLDGITVQILQGGIYVTNQQAVIVRGSPVDNQLNQNSQIDISMSGTSLVLSCHN